MQKVKDILLLTFLFSTLSAILIMLVIPAFRNIGSYIVFVIVVCMLISQTFKAVFVGIDT